MHQKYNPQYLRRLLLPGNLEEDALNSKMKPRNTCAQFDRENSHLDPESAFGLNRNQFVLSGSNSQIIKTAYFSAKDI